MWIYLPATLALIWKFWLLWYGGSKFKESKSSKYLLILLILLGITNCLEIVGLAYTNNPGAADIFLRIYYCSLIMIALFLFHLSLLSVFRTTFPRIELASAMIACLICFLLLQSDLIVAGTKSNGYSVTRIPGEFYSIFQVYMISMLITSISMLIFGYRKAENQFDKIRCLYILIGVIALALPIIGVIIAMALGSSVNAAFVLPLGVSLFLWVVTYALTKSDVFDIRVWIPFTTMRKLVKTYINEYRVSENGEPKTLKEHKETAEKLYLLKTINACKGETSVIAEKLEISVTTLGRKRQQYKI